MSAESFSPEVKAFLSEQIGSVVQLETLLLLWRHRTQRWSADAVVRELRIDRAAAAAELAELQSRGFVAASGSEPQYAWSQQTPRIETVVADVAAAYDNYRVAVISSIYSKPSDKIRVFADAFRIRKDENDG